MFIRLAKCNTTPARSFRHELNALQNGLLLLLLYHFDDDSQSENFEEVGSISRNVTPMPKAGRVKTEEEGS